MSLFPKAFTVQRRTRVLVRGVWTPGTPTTATHYGTIQPLSGKDIATLEPATMEKGAVWVRTTSALRIRRISSPNEADLVVYDGSLWELIDDRKHDNDLLPHHKYLAEYVGPA